MTPRMGNTIPPGSLLPPSPPSSLSSALEGEAIKPAVLELRFLPLPLSRLLGRSLTGLKALGLRMIWALAATPF